MHTVKHPVFDDVTQVVADPDPWVEQGWTLLSGKEEALANLEQAPPVAVELPAGNASYDAWAEYARGQGATTEDLADTTRDQLRDRYTS